MSICNWKTNKSISFLGHEIPYTIEADKVPIRIDSSLKRLAKIVTWPFYSIRNELVVDGFISREIGKLVQEFIAPDSVFLEIGCGDMSLRKYIPKNIVYNAFDISLSEFHLRRALKNDKNLNVALASVTNIPLDSNPAGVPHL